MRSSSSKWLLWTVLVLPLSFLPVGAAGQQAPQPMNIINAQPGISIEQATAIVRRQTGGRVLSAEPIKRNGKRGYSVRVLIDGERVKQFYVDSEGRASAR